MNSSALLGKRLGHAIDRVFNKGILLTGTLRGQGVCVQVAEKAMQWAPYSYSDKVVKRNDPNKKRRWLIPLILAAQVAFKVRCSRCSHHVQCLSPACC